jgi:hypothetical protein
MVRVTISIVAKDDETREMLASASWAFPVRWRSSVESLVGRIKGLARSYDARSCVAPDESDRTLF